MSDGHGQQIEIDVMEGVPSIPVQKPTSASSFRPPKPVERKDTREDRGETSGMSERTVDHE